MSYALILKADNDDYYYSLPDDNETKTFTTYIQILAALESIMQKQHTEGALSLEKSFTYPASKAWLFLTHKQKTLLQEEKVNTSKSGGRFMDACMCIVAFRTVWQDQW